MNSGEEEGTLDDGDVYPEDVDDHIYEGGLSLDVGLAQQTDDSGGNGVHHIIVFGELVFGGEEQGADDGDNREEDRILLGVDVVRAVLLE